MSDSAVGKLSKFQPIIRNSELRIKQLFSLSGLSIFCPCYILHRNLRGESSAEKLPHHVTNKSLTNVNKWSEKTKKFAYLCISWCLHSSAVVKMAWRQAVCPLNPFGNVKFCLQCFFNPLSCGNTTWNPHCRTRGLLERGNVSAEPALLRRPLHPGLLPQEKDQGNSQPPQWHGKQD